MITDKAKALQIIKEKSTTTVINLSQFSLDLRDDSDVILAAVKNDGKALRFVSDRLRDHADIVKAALDNYDGAFIYLGKNLKKDRKFILSVINNLSYFAPYYKVCSQELQYDKGFASDYLKINAFAFKYLPEEMKNKELALSALNTDLAAYRALGAFKKDPDIIKQAIKDISNIEFFPIKYKNDKDLILHGVSALRHEDNRANISGISDKLKNSKQFWLEALDFNSYIFGCASNDIKGDCELLEKVITGLGHKVDYPYSNDRELLGPQLKKSSVFFLFASQDIRNDRQLILEALQRRVTNIRYASEEIQHMLGQEPASYVEKLEKIMQIEALNNKLENSLEDKKDNRKYKI